MTNGIKDGNECTAALANSSRSSIGEEEHEIGLVDMVAQRVVDKLEEQRYVDSFLNRVIDRAANWQKEFGTNEASTVERASFNETVALDQLNDPVFGDSSWNGRMFHRYEDDDFGALRTRLLISCFKDGQGGGGVFELDFGRNSFRSVLRCNGRGIAEYDQGFIVVSREGGVYFLDRGLRLVEKHELANLDLHGTAVGPDGLLYIVETARNRVGIYTTDPFKRVDELVVSEDESDRNHINDICFHEGKLLLSMFSIDKFWRENVTANTFEGAVVEYDFQEKTVIRRIATDLRMPHTLKVIDGEICYCESFAFNVIRAGNKIAQFMGYTRGLDVQDNFYFVGQSRLRHRQRQGGLTLSGDAGLHIFRPESRMCRFIPLPTSDVYAVHVLNDLRI